MGCDGVRHRGRRRSPEILEERASPAVGIPDWPEQGSNRTSENGCAAQPGIRPAADHGRSAAGTVQRPRRSEWKRCFFRPGVTSVWLIARVTSPGAAANGKGAVSESPREHQPVLLEQVLRLLDPRPGNVILDGTVGLGGHAAAVIPRIAPGGRYFGLDLDEEMLAGARRRLASPSGVDLQLVQANYAEFPGALARAGLTSVDRMLLDLGVNSAQLDDRSRGFSFDADGPLDMRFDQQQKQRAVDLVNALPEAELADLFYHNAQEGASRKIAKRICQARHAGRITTTRALARVVEAVQSSGERRPGKTHPATRVFQALRIAVNRELDNLKTFLSQVVDHLTPGGRVAVISFHSLEDGLVKSFLREAKAAGTLVELTRRPVIAEPRERAANPRSRSAKLRVAERGSD